MVTGTKHSYVILFAIISLLAIIIAIGYFFATRASAPVYTNKINQLMFDTKNKSPRYVITLLDKDNLPLISSAKSQKVEDTSKKLIVSESSKDTFDLESLLRNIPSIRKLTPLETNTPLRLLDPISELVEEKNGFFLPRIGKNGEKPWIKYSRELKTTTQGYFKIAIVVGNLGLDKALTETLGEGLPSNISFSFSTYAKNIAQQIRAARLQGHETYIDLPLLSRDFLRADTGPKAIDIRAGTDTVIEMLFNNIGLKNAAFGGVVINPGVTDEPRNLEALLTAIRDRGLLALDATDDLNVSITQVDGLVTRRIDLDTRTLLSRAELWNSLRQVEFTAMEKGSAVILIDPRPMSLQVIKEWTDSFSPQISPGNKEPQGITEVEKPFVMVPLSDVVTE